MECDLFPENADPNICVGHSEVLEAEKRAERPSEYKLRHILFDYLFNLKKGN